MSDTPARNAASTRGRGTLTLILALVIAIAAAGGGVWWWRMPAAEDAAARPVEDPAGSAIVRMEPFVVNLADREAPRFLRVTLGLVIDEDKDAHRIEKDAVLLARTRSSILELLTTQRAGTITTPEGKVALKEAVAERAAAVLRLDVRDVLFTDFVVQF